MFYHGYECVGRVEENRRMCGDEGGGVLFSFKIMNFKV